MLAVLQACKREHSPISSAEMVRFMARSCPECVWTICAALPLDWKRSGEELLCVTREWRESCMKKKRKKLLLLSLAKWRLEVMQLQSMKMLVGRTRIFWKQTKSHENWRGQEQNQAKTGKVSPRHYSRQGRAFQTMHSSCFQNEACCGYETV